MVRWRVAKGADRVTFDVPIPHAHLWSLDDPFLYEVDAAVGDDRVRSYFGMRKISIVDLPGTEYRYVALNGRPLYLQLTLDQRPPPPPPSPPPPHPPPPPPPPS